MMIPPPETFLRCLRRWEEKIHASGWDEPSAISFIYGNQDGSVTHGPVLVLPLPEGHSPADALVGTALSMVHRPIAFPQMTNPRRLAGMAFSFEAWWNDDIELENRPPGVSLADIVGSYEVRMVTAVDTTGLVYWVIRKRGEPPMYGKGDVPAKAYLSGRVADAIRLTIICACERFLPEDGYRIPDLAAQKSALTAMLME